MSQPMIHTARPADLTLATLHDILRLRVDVFVVEQACAYPEIDGYDLASATIHRWIADEETLDLDGELGGGAPRILSYVRVIETKDGETEEIVRKLGRVVTRADARGSGMSAQVIQESLDGEAGTVFCEAQSHLENWYGRFGFVRSGPEFIEDGIPHVPMLRNL